MIPAALAAALAFGISGVAFGLLNRNQAPTSSGEPAVAAVIPAAAAAPAPAPAPSTAPAPPSEPAAVAPAPSAAPASAPAPAPAPAVAAPAPAIAAAKPASGSTVPASAVVPSAPISNEPGELVLKVDPPVDVVMDGERLGRTPLSAPAPNGKHTLKLTNPALGISVTRSINVVGKTKQEWSIGKGSVMVSAPDGATVILDGKTIGTAPVGEVSAYEGQHKITVTLGGAKYSQPFNLRPTQTMYITVELAPQE